MDHSDILSRWAQHFNQVLNCPSSTLQEAIDCMTQLPTVHSLADPPNITEVARAVRQTSSNKAAGPDGIPADVFKHGGLKLQNRLLDLFILIWDKEEVPQDYKDANIVHLYKRKGNKSVCDKRQGILLLASAGKILARILLNRTGLLTTSQPTCFLKVSAASVQTAALQT